ncbi:MAG: hypothetical protein R2713_22705 [Ilumatobacteraceae bacterium]
MAALIGLMLGSVRVVWPWPAGVDSTAIDAPSDPVWSTLLLALGGVVVVLAFNVIDTRFEHRNATRQRRSARSDSARSAGALGRATLRSERGGTFHDHSRDRTVTSTSGR